jgi:hypothetical protein
MNRLSVNVLRYGREEPPPARTVLRAGPLSCTFEEGGIRYVRLGGREVVRRIYAAVREPDWGTVTCRIGDLRIEQGPDSFRVSFNAENVRGDVDFAWSGTIAGGPDGTITFTMDGLARTAFRTARTGLCILHPIAECAGRPCTVEHTDGSCEEGRFPLLISPHQPFTAMRAISHEVAPGLRAEARFEGDAFEMEDQRNWTDASYKTYSRPLSLPYPYRIEAGESVRQVVRISLAGQPPPPAAAGGTPTLRVGAEALGPLPRIGFGAAGSRRAGALEALRPGHLRVRLRPGEAGWEAPLREAAAAGHPLEVALLPGGVFEEGLRALRAALDALGPKVAAWFILGRAGDGLAAARSALSDYGPSAPFGGGSAGGFVDLNRHRPAPGTLEAAAYGLNPQVHQFDETSMVETLEGQAWTMRTARDFLGDVSLAVGPIVLSRPPDVRQASLFCAAWTVGSLRRMCEGRAWSATYFEAAGPDGLMEAEGGRAYPVYHVFADLAGFGGGEALALAVSHPLLVDGLALRSGARKRLLASNMTDEPRTVALGGVPAAAWLRILDETNAERAMQRPDEFRAERGRPLDGDRVELLPYAVARVDWEEA